MATCDLPGALTQISMVVAEGFLPVRTDFTHLFPFLVPTKPDQTEPHQSSALVFLSYSAVESIMDSRERMRAWLGFQSLESGRWGTADF